MKYFDKNGYRNRFDILMEHLNKVGEIAKKYGFNAHMWSDMFFRLGGNGEYYVPEANIPNAVKKMVPENVSQCYWDYYHYEKGSIEDVNAKMVELILRDEHDFILIYNGNYDSVMHKNGPEGVRALAELRVNAHIFGVISQLIKTHWTHHNTLVGFAMDHGCHEIDGDCGSHGLDMPEDIEIVHLYKGYPKKNI